MNSADSAGSMRAISRCVLGPCDVRQRAMNDTMPLE